MCTWMFLGGYKLKHCLEILDAQAGFTYGVAHLLERKQRWAPHFNVRYHSSNAKIEIKLYKRAVYYYVMGLVAYVQSSKTDSTRSILTGGMPLRL